MQIRFDSEASSNDKDQISESFNNGGTMGNVLEELLDLEKIEENIFREPPQAGNEAQDKCKSIRG